jgi:hypothetical protein
VPNRAAHARTWPCELVVKQEPVKEERHEPPLWITLLIASAVGALGVWPWLIYFYLPVLVVVALAWPASLVFWAIKRHLILTRKELRKQNKHHKHNNICQKN